jgi:hypothetical protein
MSFSLSTALKACLVSGAQEFWPRQSKDLEGLREHSVKTGAVRPGPPICHKESRCFIAFKTRLLEYPTVIKKLEPQLGWVRLGAVNQRNRSLLYPGKR